jgi:hypothetical protein
MLAITTTASAEKLVVFKNGKVMLAKSVTEEAEWLKCEFEGGNFMSIPRSGVAAIEESTLPEGARGGPVNQLIDGPRGAANMPSGGRSSNDDVPRAAGRGSAQMEPPPDADAEMQRAIAEEAEARKGFSRGRGGVGQVTPQNGLLQQQQQQFQPMPGVNIQGLQPITTPSTPITGKRRSIGRQSDRGIATQQPGQEQQNNNNDE